MSWMEHRLDSGLKLRLDVTGILSNAALGESAETYGEFLVRLDAIFSEYGHELVFETVEVALQLMELSTVKRISTLIVLLRMAALTESQRVENIRERLFQLVDVKHTAISIEAHCADINRHIWSDRADLAVGALLEHFAWLELNNIAVPSTVYLEAAFTCNRFEEHLLAADFSYLAYSYAMETEDNYALDRACFFVLNSNRLANTGGEHLGAGYERQILKLEAGHSDAFLVNQFLMPIFASYVELAKDYPDMLRVNNFLGLAQEIGYSNIGYCRKAWLVATGLQALHLGKIAVARNIYEEMWCTTGREDRAVDKMAEHLGRKLKQHNIFQNKKHVAPARKKDWDALRKFAVQQQKR